MDRLSLLHENVEFIRASLARASDSVEDPVVLVLDIADSFADRLAEMLDRDAPSKLDVASEDETRPPKVIAVLERALARALLGVSYPTIATHLQTGCGGHVPIVVVSGGGATCAESTRSSARPYGIN